MIHTARTSPHAGKLSPNLHFADTEADHFPRWHRSCNQRIKHFAPIRSNRRNKLRVFGAALRGSKESTKVLGSSKVVFTEQMGNVRTGIQRHIPLVGVLAALADIFQWDASYGALTQLYAGTTIQGAELNGKYFVPWVRRDSPRSDTEDILACQMLWKWLELQVERSE
ncbi:hypothetical protein FS749_003927 [Ceratobasidium sp. UAMH 11750]|nr:hypothetical protein FS749_003927 [Ceratobasidium sp. UAMH 11750]